MLKDQDYIDSMKEMGFDFSEDDVEIIELSDDMDADIVVAVNEKKKFKLLKYSLLIIPLGIMILLINMLSNNYIIFEDVIGAHSSMVKNFSIISKQYEVAPHDIKVGDTILYNTKSKGNIGPMVVNYEKGVVKKMNNLVVYVSQEGTKDLKKINIFDVLYVIQNNN